MHRELADATWTELADGPTVLVPVGSCEQHGPHLPIGTDTMIAAAIARGAGERVDGTVVAPPLTITASGEHQGFAGTLSIGTEAMTTMLVELVRSATWASRIVFVNGHGGNADAMRRTADALAAEQRPTLVWWPDLRGMTDADDLHAGYAETSIVLAIRPDLVRRDCLAAGPSSDIEQLVRNGVRAVSPTGVLGDPTAATAEAGHRILAVLVDQLTAALAT